MDDASDPQIRDDTAQRLRLFNLAVGKSVPLATAAAGIESAFHLAIRETFDAEPSEILAAFAVAGFVSAGGLEMGAEEASDLMRACVVFAEGNATVPSEH